jgi:hypothetical protein
VLHKQLLLALSRPYLLQGLLSLSFGRILLLKQVACVGLLLALFSTLALSLRLPKIALELVFLRSELLNAYLVKQLVANLASYKALAPKVSQLLEGIKLLMASRRLDLIFVKE